MTVFSRERRGSAMGIWGLGMMVIPVLGPTFGGFLTDHLNWRWVFYVNVPLGTVALLLASAYVPDVPARPTKTDFVGLALLILSVGSLQLTLDLGNSHDWFNSILIQTLALTALISAIAFVAHCWDRPGAIVNLSVYKDRNFVCSSLLMVSFAIGISSTSIFSLRIRYSNRSSGPSNCSRNTSSASGGIYKSCGNSASG